MTKRKASDSHESSGSSNAKKSVRLLLHTADGAVPYLTPSSLRKYFPADSSHRLIIGLAARDTCVVPVYLDGKARPRGYTFSSTNTFDAWLHDYVRATVPSFDLVEDEPDQKHPVVTVTDQHVMTWTSNGRLPLTPQLYFEASQGLASHTTLPLYDIIPPSGEKSPTMASNPKGQARIRAAITRTREWSQQWLDKSHVLDSNAWVPVLVDPIRGVDLQYQADFLDSACSHQRVKGVALVGWNHLRDESMAQKSLVDVCEQVRARNVDVVVLAVNSLRQLVLAIAHGCSVVGCNLAAQWADSGKACLVDIGDWRSVETNKNVKRRRTNHDDGCILDEDGCVSLTPTRNVKSHHWFADKSPMVHGCTCFACSTHSRSYIYHLFCSKELLGNMLLMIHNLHHLLQLLEQLENARELGQTEQCFDFICRQLKQM